MPGADANRDRFIIYTMAPDHHSFTHSLVFFSICSRGTRRCPSARRPSVKAMQPLAVYGLSCFAPSFTDAGCPQTALLCQLHSL